MNCRKITILILTVACFVLWSSDANAGVIVNRPLALGLENGLVGYWSFDGSAMGTTSAIDSSGNGNTGWLTNGPVREIGKIGQALEFDGSDDYVNAGNGSSINVVGNFTGSAWVNI